MLTTYDLDDLVYRRSGPGAAGFLLKTTPAERLVEGIRLWRARAKPSCRRRDPAPIEQHVDGRVPTEPRALVGLTARERHVLLLSRTAVRTLRSPPSFGASRRRTQVKTHVNRLFAKLRLQSRAQAVVLAYESGLVVPGRSQG